MGSAFRGLVGADMPAGGVGTANLADGAVTNAKLAAVPANTVKGSIAGGAPADLTATQVTTLCNTVTTGAKGCVPAIPNNTTTFFRGDGSYAAPPASAIVLLNALTASNSATLDDTTSITGSFGSYLIVYSNLVPATNATDLNLHLHSGGAFQTATYRWSGVFQSVSTVSGTSDNPGAQLDLTGGNARISNVAGNGGVSGQFTINSPSQTASFKSLTGNASAAAGSGTSAPWVITFGGGWTGGTGAIDGIRLFMTAGNIVSGTVKIYGIN